MTLAVEEGHLAIVRMLVDAGLTCSSRTLEKAVSDERREIVKILAKSGEDLNFCLLISPP